MTVIIAEVCGICAASGAEVLGAGLLLTHCDSGFGPLRRPAHPAFPVLTGRFRNASGAAFAPWGSR